MKKRVNIIDNLYLIKKKLESLGYTLTKRLGEKSAYGITYKIDGKIKGAIGGRERRKLLLDNLDIIKKKLAKQGYNLVQFAGQGSYGIAYLTDKGNIVKITLDEDELQTSAQLVDKNLKHVVKIYRVFGLITLPEFGFIVQEALKPISQKIDDVIQKLDLHGTITFTTCEDIAKKYNLKYMDNIRDYLAIMKGDSLVADHKWNKVRDDLKNTKDEWNSLKPIVRAFIAYSTFHSVPAFGDDTLQTIDDNLSLVSQLFESFAELNEHHIRFTDTHGENLMKDNSGTLKWVDLGYGSTALGKSKIERIQGAKKFKFTDREQILKYLKQIKIRLAIQGYTLGKAVGYHREYVEDEDESSGYGIAFRVGNNKVLKITLDQNEAETSSKLLNKYLKHVVQIYRVFTLTSLPGLYFILQEELYPLSDKEVEIMSDINFLEGSFLFEQMHKLSKKFKFKKFDDIGKYVIMSVEHKPWERDPWQINPRDSYYKRFIQKRMESFELAKSYLNNIIEHWNELLPETRAFVANYIYLKRNVLDYADKHSKFKEFKSLNDNIEFINKIFETLQELYKNKIYFIDAHSGNLMKDSHGVYKWIDLGGESHAPGKRQIEKIQGAK